MKIKIAGKKIYIGKTKDLFSVGGNSARLVLSFKDNVLGRKGIPDAGGNEVVGTSKKKGIACAALTAFFLKRLEKSGVQTHFIKKVSPRKILIKKTDKIPIEFICRNYAFGSYLRRHKRINPLSPLKEIIEYTLKSDAADDPILTKKQIRKYLTSRELKAINSKIRRVNRVLIEICGKKNILLADFKVEFGRTKNKLLIIDDFSTDTARFFLGRVLLEPFELMSRLKKL